MRARLLLVLTLSCFSLMGAGSSTGNRAAAAEPVCHAAAASAMQRRTRLAAYYELTLALVNGRVFEWSTGQAPRLALQGAVQVAVSASFGFAIDDQRRVVAWRAGSDRIEVLLDNAVWLAAGDSGLLVVRCDGSLWQREASARDWARVADTAVHAWVGDGADYYVDPAGGLFVRGKAQRGQYGDGRLAEAPGWTRVAGDAVAVVAHTGHALYLRRDGVVLGTGGNRFGPLGRHGYGDKADRWGVVFEGANVIATGSRHSLAVRPDGSLWTWGAGEGLTPKHILSKVVAASGGLNDSVALTTDGVVWTWAPGQVPARLTLPP